MKKLFYLAICAASVAMVGCSNEAALDQINSTAEKGGYKATIAVNKGESTRMVLEDADNNGSWTYAWEKTDQLGLGINGNKTLSPFTVVGDKFAEGSNLAYFEGFLPLVPEFNSSYVGYTPAAAGDGVVVNDDKTDWSVEFEIPAVQEGGSNGFLVGQNSAQTIDNVKLSLKSTTPIVRVDSSWGDFTEAKIEDVEGSVGVSATATIDYTFPVKKVITYATQQVITEYGVANYSGTPGESYSRFSPENKLVREVCDAYRNAEHVLVYPKYLSGYSSSESYIFHLNKNVSFAKNETSATTYTVGNSHIIDIWGENGNTRFYPTDEVKIKDYAGPKVIVTPIVKNGTVVKDYYQIRITAAKANQKLRIYKRNYYIFLFPYWSYTEINSDIVFNASFNTSLIETTPSGEASVDWQYRSVENKIISTDIPTEWTMDGDIFFAGEEEITDETEWTVSTEKEVAWTENNRGVLSGNAKYNGAETTVTNANASAVVATVQSGKSANMMIAPVQQTEVDRWIPSENLVYAAINPALGIPTSEMMVTTYPTATETEDAEWIYDGNITNSSVGAVAEGDYVVGDVEYQFMRKTIVTRVNAQAVVYGTANGTATTTATNASEAGRYVKVSVKFEGDDDFTVIKRTPATFEPGKIYIVKPSEEDL